MTAFGPLEEKDVSSTQLAGNSSFVGNVINDTVVDANSTEPVSFIGEGTEAVMNTVLAFLTGWVNMDEYKIANVTSIHQLPGCKSSLSKFVDSSLGMLSTICYYTVTMQVSNDKFTTTMSRRGFSIIFLLFLISLIMIIFITTMRDALDFGYPSQYAIDV